MKSAILQGVQTKVQPFVRYGAAQHHKVAFEMLYAESRLTIGAAFLCRISL